MLISIIHIYLLQVRVRPLVTIANKYRRNPLCPGRQGNGDDRSLCGAYSAPGKDSSHYCGKEN